MKRALIAILLILATQPGLAEEPYAFFQLEDLPQTIEGARLRDQFSRVHTEGPRAGVQEFTLDYATEPGADADQPAATYGITLTYFPAPELPLEELAAERRWVEREALRDRAQIRQQTERVLEYIKYPHRRAPDAPPPQLSSQKLWRIVDEHWLMVVRARSGELVPAVTVAESILQRAQARAQRRPTAVPPSPTPTYSPTVSPTAEPTVTATPSELPAPLTPEPGTPSAAAAVSPQPTTPSRPSASPTASPTRAPVPAGPVNSRESLSDSSWILIPVAGVILVLGFAVLAARLLRRRETPSLEPAPWEEPDVDSRHPRTEHLDEELVSTSFGQESVRPPTAPPPSIEIPPSRREVEKPAEETEPEKAPPKEPGPEDSSITSYEHLELPEILADFHDVAAFLNESLPENLELLITAAEQAETVAGSLSGQSEGTWLAGQALEAAARELLAAVGPIMDLSDAAKVAGSAVRSALSPERLEAERDVFTEEAARDFTGAATSLLRTAEIAEQSLEELKSLTTEVAELAADESVESVDAMAELADALAEAARATGEAVHKMTQTSRLAETVCRALLQPAAAPPEPAAPATAPTPSPEIEPPPTDPPPAEAPPPVPEDETEPGVGDELPTEPEEQTPIRLKDPRAPESRSSDRESLLGSDDNDLWSSRRRKINLDDLDL